MGSFRSGPRLARVPLYEKADALRQKGRYFLPDRKEGRTCPALPSVVLCLHRAGKSKFLLSRVIPTNAFN
jgi:hypothetical protein